jgi:hypothetical protein
MDVSRRVWGGLAMIVGGFVGAIMGDVWAEIRSLVPRAIDQSWPIPLHWLFFGGLMIVGLFVVLYDVGVKLHVWPQDFETRLSGRHGTDFLVGETVRFEARFRGELKNGFFTCKVRPPEHTILPYSNKDYVWWANYKTYDEPKDLGLLNGRGSTRFLLFWRAHKSVWGNKIPFDYPAGKYRANVEVYNGDERGKPLRSIEMTFTVKHEDLKALHAWMAGAFVANPTFR